jgi:hypothetical protein
MVLLLQAFQAAPPRHRQSHLPLLGGLRQVRHTSACRCRCPWCILCCCLHVVAAARVGPCCTIAMCDCMLPLCVLGVTHSQVRQLAVFGRQGTVSAAGQTDMCCMSPSFVPAAPDASAQGLTAGRISGGGIVAGKWPCHASQSLCVRRQSLSSVWD